MVRFRTLDLNLLRVFDAVMSEGGVTRAAKALSLTQPAVSQALRRLREALGDELFTRTSQGLRPTPRAEWLWPQVRGALASLHQAIAPEHYDPRRDPASWRLAMADAAAARLMPPLMSALEALGGRVDLRALPLLTRDPRPLLDSGEIDLALGSFPAAVQAIAAAGPDTTLRHERLYDTRYVCVMRRDHPLARGELTLDAFCAAHHLMVSFSGRARGRLDQALAALGRERRIVLTVNQYFTAGRVAAQCDLLAVLPESIIDATGLHGQIEVRELPLALPPVTVEMLWHLRHDARAAHRWLREQLRAAGAASTVSR